MYYDCVFFFSSRRRHTRSCLVSWARRCVQETAISISLIGLGYILRIWVPLNKQLWSISFTFATSGYSGLSLVLIFLLIDIWQNKWIQFILQPFVWLGMNPLFIYVCMMFFADFLAHNLSFTSVGDYFMWVANHFFGWVKPEGLKEIMNSFMYAILWTFVAWILYKKKIFIKL
eukprot:TRINITY_DN30690_c0_g1_i3.p2 TRINITY_DN30690_c0_g1~~TRINITY_DN30690_c0_g1_i3.p2  ORF type:complete len:173 (+),score=15.44 TRINITY_DN30690_c0_g1_i3:72-590(+)